MQHHDLQPSNTPDHDNQNLEKSNASCCDKPHLQQDANHKPNTLTELPESLSDTAYKALQDTLNNPEILQLFAKNLEAVKQFSQNQNDMAKHLGIKFTQAKPGYIEATMPVDERTCRLCYPVNILNGGASIALAENMAGLGSLLLCQPKQNPCGIQVSANHLRMVTIGHTVTAIAKLVHFGSTLHMWDVNIFNEQSKVVSSVRVTNMIIKESLKN